MNYQKFFLSFMVFLLAITPTYPAMTLNKVELIRSSNTLTQDASTRYPNLIGGSPVPTVNISPAEGYFGQTVTVTGQGVAPYPGVRVAWWYGEATLTAAVVKLGANNSYSASLMVPDEAPVGLVKICATVTEMPLAQYACADFTVKAPPPGGVYGQLPGFSHSLSVPDAPEQQLPATVMLLDTTGKIVASTHIEVDGSFALPGIDPGYYLTAITGTLPILVESSPIEVHPATDSQLAMNNIKADCNPSRPDAAISRLIVDPNGLAGHQPYPQAGYYIMNGPAIPINIKATTETRQVEDGQDPIRVTAVDFSFCKGDCTEANRVPIATVTNSINDVWKTTYPNVADRTQEYVGIWAQPVTADSANCVAGMPLPLMMVENPFDDPLVLIYLMMWIPGHGESGAYEFRGRIPYVPGLLPLIYPEPITLPALGTVENKLDVYLSFHGYLELNGKVVLDKMKVGAYAHILVDELYNDSYELLKPGQTVELDLEKPEESKIVIDYFQLGSYSVSNTINVFSYGIPGIASVDIQFKYGVGLDLYTRAWIQPLVPRAGGTLTPEISAYLGVAIKATLLFILSASASATFGGGVCMPLEYDTRAQPPVWLNTPGLYLYFHIKIYLDLWLFNVTLWSKDIFREQWGSECPARSKSIQATEQALFDVMANPVVAAGPGGLMLTSYIENTAPTDEAPVLKVMARFWDDAAKDWAAAVPLTGGDYLVHDPAVAFVGPDGQALVAWSQNSLTSDQLAAEIDPLNAILASQEIYYAYWNGSTWSAPIRLTSDTHGDGFPVLAGDNQGATLAWVSDIDGDMLTFTDWRIMVTDWDLAQNSFRPIETLSAEYSTPTDQAEPADMDAALENALRAYMTQATAPQLSPASSSELHVCATCPYTSLQSAVDAANPGDVIKVAAGTYHGINTRGGLRQLVYLDKPITLLGGYNPANWNTPDIAANPTVLDAQGQGRVIYITGDIQPTIEGFQITGGNAQGLGGGLQNGNSGGGVYINTAAARLYNNQIYLNTAGASAAYASGGGVFVGNSPAVLQSNQVYSNTVAGNSTMGGGIQLYQSPALLSQNSVYTNTVGGGYGGGISLYQSQAEVIDNIVTDNKSGSLGGGISIRNSTGAALVGNQIDGNRSSSHGGGVYINASDQVFVRRNTIVNNSALGGHGGGIRIDEADVTVSGNTVSNNQAVSGGGAYFTSYSHASTFRYNTISSNTATSMGGGVAIYMTPQVNFDQNIVSSNTAQSGGGLDLESSPVTITHNQIFDNHSTFTSGGGGGIYLASSNANLDANLIRGNSAVNLGGGLYLSNSKPAISNTAIISNTVQTSGSGLYSGNSSQPQLTHITLANNSGGDGVGIVIKRGGAVSLAIDMKNMLIANQAIGVSAEANVTVNMPGVVWFNNLANTSGAGIFNITQAHTGDPAFASDGYHLGSPSAATDQGIDIGVISDIDGGLRPKGSAPDLGADEYNSWAAPMNAEVALTRRNGQPILTWTVDGDGIFGTNGDRLLAMAEKEQGSWNINLLDTLPRGTDSPTIAAFGSDGIQLAFLVRGDVAAGDTSAGYGNEAVLWVAEQNTTTWSSHPLLDDQDQIIRAEQPRLVHTQDETLLLFRRFGEYGTNAALGQLALAALPPGMPAGAPVFLTDSPYQFWLNSLAVNQVTDEAMVMAVKRPMAEDLQQSAVSSSTQLRPSTLNTPPILKLRNLSPSQEGVLSFTMDPTADPALDPNLAVSQLHAVPGSTVVVTATVRNVGRGLAQGMAVSFFSGTPITGTLLATISLPDSLRLGLNDTHVVEYPIIAGTGKQPISAKLTTTGQDSTLENNVASVNLRDLPAPFHVTVQKSGLFENTLQVMWFPPEIPGIAGYRILRSEKAGGPYELVGLSTGLYYHDLLLYKGHTYFYVIQAYDAGGVWSEFSMEANGTLESFRILLPIILKRPTR